MKETAKAISVQETYGSTLLRLGAQDSRIVALDADLMKAAGSLPFKEKFPDRHFQVGVAEQNLVGIATGLAAMGKIPFASTFANFISQRSCDQAVNSVAYNRFNVKLCGTFAGLTNEKNGGTHISVEDIAVYRSMPNFVVVVPGDCIELASVMEFAAQYEGPVYLRIARGPLNTFLPDDYSFALGKAVVLEDGTDASIITTGITTREGKTACQTLREKGINVRHIHMPSIKPIDRDEIIRAAEETGRIVTVENHSRLGGLGSAVAETVCDSCPVPVKRLGMDDLFGETATLDWLLDRFGISSPHIVSAVEDMLKG